MTITPRLLLLAAALTAPAPAAAQPAAAPAPPPRFDSTSLAALQWRNIGPFRGGRVVAVQGLVARTRGTAGGDALEKAGTALVARLDALEEALVQKRVVDGQTVINFPQRLNQYYVYLRSAIDASDSGTTDGQQSRLAALGEDWARQQRTAATLLGDELAAFNRLVRDRNIPAVVVK